MFPLSGDPLCFFCHAPRSVSFNPRSFSHFSSRFTSRFTSASVHRHAGGEGWTCRKCGCFNGFDDATDSGYTVDLREGETREVRFAGGSRAPLIGCGAPAVKRGICTACEVNQETMMRLNAAGKEKEARKVGELCEECEAWTAERLAVIDR
jgi:hypothetical protein